MEALSPDLEVNTYRRCQCWSMCGSGIITCVRLLSWRLCPQTSRLIRTYRRSPCWTASHDGLWLRTRVCTYVYFLLASLLVALTPLRYEAAWPLQPQPPPGVEEAHHLRPEQGASPALRTWVLVPEHEQRQASVALAVCRRTYVRTYTCRGLVPEHVLHANVRAYTCGGFVPERCC